MAEPVSGKPRPKASNKIWEGILGVVERYSKRQLIAIVAVNIVVAGGMVYGVWYYLHRDDSTRVQLNTEDPYAKNIRRLEQEQVPKDPLEQAIYYSQIAQNYETLKFYDEAIKYYLKAQVPIDKNNLKDELSFYAAIATDYARKKDNKNAKKYYQLEVERLKGYRQRHPDDPGASDVIKETEDKISQL